MAPKDYVEWARTVADAMANERIEPHRFFSRFAREVSPLDPDDGVPRSILLDVWDLLDVADETQMERRWDKAAVAELLSYDTCCEVQDRRANGEKTPRYCFDFGPYEVELKYHFRKSVPPSARYSVSCAQLNSAVADGEDDTSDREIDPNNRMFGRRLSTSLTRLINQDQAFRIVPSLRGVVYSHSHFYKPEIDDAVLSVLEPSALLGGVISEKGDTRVKARSAWGHSTLFGLIYGWIDASTAPADPFARDIRRCSLIICDDRNHETADFYGIDDVNHRVMIVHAKADDATPGVSPRKLQEVTRQALTSLAFGGSSRRDFPLPSEWKEDWSVKLKDAGNAAVSRSRLIAKTRTDIKTAHTRLMEALSDPTYVKEVIMLTSGILSAAGAQRTAASDDQHDLQFLYFLAGARSSFDRAGVRYRIICNP